MIDFYKILILRVFLLVQGFSKIHLQFRENLYLGFMALNQTPNAIYGFYSSHTNKHLYSPYKRTDSAAPRTQPGAYYYELDRFLGVQREPTGKSQVLV